VAYRPCLTCGQRFYGASEFTYVTWYVGEDKFSFRLTECRVCASDRRNAVSAVADVRSEQGWEMSVDPALQLLQLERVVVTDSAAVDPGEMTVVSSSSRSRPSSPKSA